MFPNKLFKKKIKFKDLHKILTNGFLNWTSKKELTTFRGFKFNSSPT